MEGRRKEEEQNTTYFGSGDGRGKLIAVFKDDEANEEGAEETDGALADEDTGEEGV